MKKIFSLSLFLVFIFGFFMQAKAMGFVEAYNKSASKPAAILVYADWASNIDGVLNNFRKVQAKQKDKYNFVILNIADRQAKVFNSKYYFYSGIPYIFLIKNNGKVTKVIQQDCLQSTSCIVDKMSTFTK